MGPFTFLCLFSGGYATGIFGSVVQNKFIEHKERKAAEARTCAAIRAFVNDVFESKYGAAGDDITVGVSGVPLKREPFCVLLKEGMREACMLEVQYSDHPHTDS